MIETPFDEKALDRSDTTAFHIARMQQEAFCMGYEARRVYENERSGDARIDELEAALKLSYDVLKNVTELYHLKYLLHTDALFKKCQAALRIEE